MADVDLSEFEAHVVQHGPRCGVRKLLDILPPEDSAKLEAALAAEHLPHSALARWCKAKGHHLSPDTISRHRKDECGCGRSSV